MSLPLRTRPLSVVLFAALISLGCDDKGGTKPPADTGAGSGGTTVGGDADSGGAGSGATDCYIGSEEAGNLDADCDGLSDATEMGVTLTDPNDIDTDGDGLTDYEEIVGVGDVVGPISYPLCVDSDGDTIPDGDEVDEGWNPLDPDDPGTGSVVSPSCLDGHVVVDYGADADGDGLKLHVELQYGSSDDSVDTDGDGLSDPEEVEGVAVTDFNDADGDGDTADKVRVHPHPNDWDSDDDGWSDGDEVGHDGCILNPVDPDSDGDTLMDGDELKGVESDPEAAADLDVVYESDPCLQHSDGDGIRDDVERDAQMDPMSLDTDADNLSDAEEYAAMGMGGCNETSPILADTDGDGVRDKIEVLLSSVAGSDACASDAGQTPEYFDPRGGAGSLGAVASCGTWGEAYGQSFAREFYDMAFYHPELGGRECVCSFLIATETPVDVIDAVVYTPVDAHQAGSGSYPGWVDEPVAAGVLASLPWVTDDVLSSGFLDENVKSEEYWTGFNDPVDDGTSSGVLVELGGEVVLRVANGNLAKNASGNWEPDHIASCSELAHSASSEGLQFRLTTASSFMEGMAPPTRVPPRDAAHCSGAAKERSLLGLLPRSGGPAAAVALSGGRALGGAALQRLRVKDWAGADGLTLVGPDGARLALRRGGPQASAEVPPGWALDAVQWYAWSDTGEAVGMPRVEVASTCGAMTSPPPRSQWGYQLSTHEVQRLLSAAGPLELAAFIPDLAVDDHPGLRLRLLRPKAFHGGPGQTRLRVDAAGLGTLAHLRLEPNVQADDLTKVDPLTVDRWTFHWPTPAGVFKGTAVTGDEALVLTVSYAGPAGSVAPLEVPLTLTLPSEAP